MTKKSETHELHDKAKKEPVKPAGEIHLKVLADLFTADTTYIQGQVVEVDAEEATRLQSEYAGYFEVVPNDQEEE